MRIKRVKKILVFFLVAYIVSSILLWIFEIRFESNQWKEEPTNRYEMVDDLIESQILLDKTKKEVIVILGEPNSIGNQSAIFLYTLGTPPSFFSESPEQLMVIFESETVSEVTLATE